MKRNCLIILLLALCLPPSIFCQTIEIENKIAGELHNQITDHSVTNLTIKGHINRTDLDFINSELRQLKSLNLKNTFIDAYQDPDDYEFGYYAANIFPSSFSANSSIEKLILPVSLKGMGVSCLNNPSQLTHLVSYSEIPPVADEDYPYIGNPDFLNRCVLLVPNNSIDTYRNAPGWNFATIMPIADESDEPGKPQEKYILSTDKLVLEKWLSDDETVDMSSIKELQRVKTIGKDAFGSLTRANNVLKKIILSENIQKIDDYAFANCNALKEIVFNPKINFLGVGAFFNCKSLKSIELPNSITDIERASFSGCAALASVSLSNSLQTLSNSIFYGCISLQEITIPESIQLIGDGAFSNCSVLETINWEQSHITKIGAESFAACSSLRSITIPDKTIMLGESAFSGCSDLRTVNFNNVEIIGKDAFRGTALTDIDFSKTKIKEIGAFAFSGLDLVDVAMPSSITHIGVSAFEKCEKLKTFSIPINANLSILSDRCLKSCSSLRAIDLGKVEKIGNGVFALCTSLKTIKWSDSLKEIGATAFMTCTSLSEIIIPNSVHSIDDWAFYECSSVEKLIVGDSTKTIGVECFSLSSSLKDIFIGQSVEKIKKWAFRKVNSLQNFSIKTNSLPALEKEVFSDVDLSNATLKVKEDLVEEYKAAEQWKEFGSIVSYKDTRNTLPEYTPFTLNNNKITAIGYHIAVYDFSGNLIIQGFDQVDLMMKHLQPTLILIKLHNERYQYTTKLAIQ